MNFSQRRNPCIELLRFVFAMVIAVFHLHYVVPGRNPAILNGGYLGVEFFFLVTGFLLASDVFQGRNADLSVGQASWKFVYKKAKGIFPAYLIAFLFTTYIYIYIYEYGCKYSLNLLKDSFFQITMLEMAGSMHLGFYLNGTWYLSAMLLSCLVIYPIIRANYDVFVRILSPIIVVCFLFYGFQYVGALAMVDKVVGLIYEGMLRALAEISLGCICFELCQMLKTAKWKYKSLLLSAAEGICYAVSLSYINGGGYTSFDFTVLFLLAIGVTCSFTGETLLCRILSSRTWLHSLSCYLGHISLSVYLLHLLFVQVVFPQFFANITDIGEMYALYICLVILSAVLYTALTDVLFKKKTHKVT